MTCPSLLRVTHRGSCSGSQSLLGLPLMSDNLKLQEGAEVGRKALYLTVIQITIPTRVFSVFVVPFIAPLCRGLSSVSEGQRSVRAVEYCVR